MKRRKFVASVAAGSLVAPQAMGSSFLNAEQNEIYEMRTYEMAWGGNWAMLKQYLKEVEGPYLKSNGANTFLTFDEYGQDQPAKLWTLASFPDFDSYQKAIVNRSGESLVQNSTDYTNAGKIFTRFSSSLLYGFDGLKQMKAPIDGASLYELRIYEGVNEDAVRRKTNMFNHEELDLFYRVDMNPIFFGSMVVGPYMPSLVYMLNFRDMAHRDQAWKNFVEHPEWLVMRDKPEYANSVSNIRRVFLRISS